MLSIGSTVEAAAVALLDAAALAALASFFFGFLSGPFFLCAWARSDVQLFTHTYGVYLYMFNWSEREKQILCRWPSAYAHKTCFRSTSLLHLFDGPARPSAVLLGGPSERRFGLRWKQTPAY